MTETEEQQLRELADDLANAAQSTSEPRCIVAAFATPPKNRVVLTMQHWIDLEAIRSPLLELRLPEHLEELEQAANVCSMSILKLPIEGVIAIARGLRHAVAQAFSLALPMGSAGDRETTSGSDGFGAWLPLFTFLVVECGLAATAARELPVDQAFALLAACRRAQGWKALSATYAERDVMEERRDK